MFYHFDRTRVAGQSESKSFLVGEIRNEIDNRPKNCTADMLEQVADLDDLVLQFDGTDAGKRFIEAWKRARIIVDTGGGHGSTPPIPPTLPSK